MERGNPGRRDRKNSPLWKQTDAAFENDLMWNQIASNNTQDSETGETVMCESKCTYFNSFSGPKVKSGRVGPDEGRCRVKKTPKKGYPIVSYNTSICLHPKAKKLR